MVSEHLGQKHLGGQGEDSVEAMSIASLQLEEVLKLKQVKIGKLEQEVTNLKVPYALAR